MLLAAIQRQDTTQVYIDLLTQGDLAALKAKKAGQPMPPKPEPSEVDPRSKRYLILTLFGEFEKCHYPMPLNYLEEPDIAKLRQTFARMHSELTIQAVSAQN